MQDSPRENPVPEADFDVVEAASEQSFPASDPPGWATGQLHDTAAEEASPLPARRRQRGLGAERGRPPPHEGLGPPR